MNIGQILTLPQVQVVRLGISVKRVAIWTLIFTDAFFLSYFFVRLFHGRP